MIEIQRYTNGVLNNLLRNAFSCMGVETNEDNCFLGTFCMFFVLYNRYWGQLNAGWNEDMSRNV